MRLSNAQKRGLDGRERIFQHIVKTGRTIAGQLVWTDQEKEALRKYYPDQSTLAAALPDRTMTAISKKAQQLRLVHPLRIWSDDEVRRLRTPYTAGIPIDQMEFLLPGKVRRQIWNKAHNLGYKRPRKAPTPTGMPLVDAVRRRAFDLNWLMKDLDSSFGMKCRSSSLRHVNWRGLQRAMIEFEGQPKVHWHDTSPE